ASLLLQSAIMRRTAVPPRLLFLLAGVIAGPEQRFAAGKPVQERVAAVAGARAADHALLGGTFQPARQGRALRAVCLDGPALQNRLLAELFGGAVQNVVQLGPGLHKWGAVRVRPTLVVVAISAQLVDQSARILDV